MGLATRGLGKALPRIHTVGMRPTENKGTAPGSFTAHGGLSTGGYAELKRRFHTPGATFGYNRADSPELGEFPRRNDFRLSAARLDAATQAGDVIDSVYLQGGREAAIVASAELAAKPPRWIDMARVRRGQEVGRRYFTCLAISLGNLSLIGGFGASKINRVLVKGSRLSMASEGRGYDPLPRLVETTVWLLHVLRGAEPGTLGHEKTLEVRALHAMIRQHLLERDWDVEALDFPINQEQMLATLIGFGYNGVWGLRLMGVRLTRDEEEDFIHLWSYVGHLLGIDEDLLPRSYEDARAITLQILPRLLDPDEGTREIIENLHQRREANIGLPRVVQESMCRFFLPGTYADALGLPGNVLVDWVVSGAYRTLGGGFSLWASFRPGDLERWEMDRVSRRLEELLEKIRQGETGTPRPPARSVRAMFRSARSISQALLSV